MVFKTIFAFHISKMHVALIMTVIIMHHSVAHTNTMFSYNTSFNKDFTTNLQHGRALNSNTT